MLEAIFSPGHQYHNRLFYDRAEGQYYDLHTDLYLTIEEVRAFGLPV